MKCYRILYKPDNTAFMVWAENKQQALDIAHEKNKKELPPDQEIDITDLGFLLSTTFMKRLNE